MKFTEYVQSVAVLKIWYPVDGISVLGIKFKTAISLCHQGCCTLLVFVPFRIFATPLSPVPLTCRSRYPNLSLPNSSFDSNQDHMYQFGTILLYISVARSAQLPWPSQPHWPQFTRTQDAGCCKTIILIHCLYPPHNGQQLYSYNLRGSLNVGNYLTGWKTVGFSISNLPHEVWWCHIGDHYACVICIQLFQSHSSWRLVFSGMKCIMCC